MGRHLVRLLLALLGLVAIAIGVLVFASIHPAIGIVAFLVLIPLGVYRVLATGDWFEGLIEQGRGFVAELGTAAVIFLTVVGWALVGVLVAILFMLPALVLSPEDPTHPAVMLAMVGIWAFFATLVVGPILTLRRFLSRRGAYRTLAPSSGRAFLDGPACPRCRNPLPVGASVCLACGQPISVESGTAGPASRGGRLTGNRQDRRPFLATIGAGLACGVIWSLFLPPDDASDVRATVWLASAAVIGVVAGLPAGVAGRPLLLLGWYLTAVGAVSVALPWLLGEDPNAADAGSPYLIAFFVLFAGGSAVAAFGLGWVLRRLRIGRSP